MLVLSRKLDQRLFIGDAIVVTVCSIRGDVVRLGIDAPRDVVILREEIAPLPVRRAVFDDGPIHPEAVG